MQKRHHHRSPSSTPTSGVVDPSTHAADPSPDKKIQNNLQNGGQGEEHTLGARGSPRADFRSDASRPLREADGPGNFEREEDVNYTMKMTTAEFRGYQQLCERGGGPMMGIACDQRGGMRKLLVTDPKEEGGIGQDILGDTKSDIVEFLGNHASCVLLDPVCAVPRVIDEAVLARECALLIGLDDSGWDVQPDTRYRLSKLVPGSDARRG